MHVSWRLESASVRRIDRIIVDGNCQGLDVVLDSMEVIALKTTEWGGKSLPTRFRPRFNGGDDH